MAKNQNYVRNILRNNLANEGREMIDWKFYDSLLTTVSISQNLTFFQNTIGTTSVDRTNMKSAGQLPSPQSFVITEIAFKLINADGTSLYYSGGATAAIHPANVIFSKFTWNIKVEPSIEYEGHGSDFWEEQGYLNDSGTTLAAWGYPNSPWKTVKFKAPILLIANRAFSVNVNLTAPAAAQGYTAANTRLYCYLKGLLRRNP